MADFKERAWFRTLLLAVGFCYAEVAIGQNRQTGTTGPIVAQSPSKASSQPQDVCDQNAAAPLDPQKPTNIAGVAFNDINAKKAISSCEVAVRAFPENGRFTFQLGRAFEADGQKGAAFSQYGLAAALGYGMARHHLGLLLFSGFDEEAADKHRAIDLLRAAAAQGVAPAMRALGDAYSEGNGVEQDLVQARDWYDNAVKAGDLEAGMNTSKPLQDAPQQSQISSFDDGAPPIFNLGIERGKEQATATQSSDAANRCDLLAASPLDVSRRFGVEGIALGSIDGASAIAACNEAVRADPQNQRLNFQLGRAQQAAGRHADAMAPYQIAASQGHALAENNLASIYFEGLDGQPQDKLKALWLFRTAADKGVAIAMRTLGNAYRDGDGIAADKTEAARWFRKGAEGGDADAIYNIGLMLANGDGIPKDEAEAVEWFRKGANAGSDASMFSLGFMLSNGKGVAKDEGEGLNWYRKSAETGNATAMVHLAEKLEAGVVGAPRDTNAAIEWYRKAAAQNDKTAIERLAALTKAKDSTPPAADIGNSDGEIQKLKERAEAGDRRAVLELAELFYTKNDKAEAAKWYLKAAEQGDVIAQHSIAIMYDNGYGVAQNKSLAIQWYHKAAEQNYLDSQFNLAFIYFNGEGVAQDKAQGIEWYHKAATQGHARAQYNLGNKYYTGDGAPQNNAIAMEWYLKSAEQGNPPAQFTVAHFYETGQVVPQDTSLALGWYRKAAAAGHADAPAKVEELDRVLRKPSVPPDGTEEGKADSSESKSKEPKNNSSGNSLEEEANKWQSDIEDKIYGESNDADFLYIAGESKYFGYTEAIDKARAFKIFRRAAELGHAKAQFSIAVMYSKGEAVEQDMTLAAHWYEKAAEKSHIKAQYNIGVMYENGEGVAQNKELAARWYRKAAAQDDPYAQHALGSLYWHGKGVPQDRGAAIEWYRKSAEQGNADGQNALGVAYFYGKGVPKDLNAAAEWYRKAAEQGVADAQFAIGNSYHNGEGVPKDSKLAAEWYQKAAEQGHAFAQFNLGVLYKSGDGVAQDKTLAVQWFRKAADQSEALALNQLGVAYDTGEGAPKDSEIAAEWYKKAADLGDAMAQSNLANMYLNGEGVPKNTAAAFAWYLKAAEQGHARAQYAIGVMYANGQGVSASKRVALDWLRKAASNGSGDAKAFLERLGR